MDYKEKYEMALEGIQEILGSGEDSIKMSRLQLRLQGIFPELKESEDERIRKAIHIYLDWLDGKKDYAPRGEYTINDMIDWIEKQGKHQKFRDSIQVGDKVTRNEDGVLVNLSQLNRVAKKDEKQGEQKAIIVPKFRVGNTVRAKTMKNFVFTIKDITDKQYVDTNDGKYDIEGQDLLELVEQKPVDWSEEDETKLNDVIRLIENSGHVESIRKHYVGWLKSLKERYAWKPSDEQMDALRYVTNFDYGGYKAILVSLYEQLKKLRKEQL